LSRAAVLLACLTIPSLHAQSGRVVSAISGDGLRNASVLLRGVGTTTVNYLTETDGSGNFAVSGMPPGIYECVATRVGFAAGPRNRVGSGAAPPRIVITAGQAAAPITLRLTPLGVISGRVLDNDGVPIRDAAVTVMRYGFSGSGKTLTERGRATSNDRGEFRLFGLDPGSYYVNVQPPSFAIEGRSVTFGPDGRMQVYTQMARQTGPGVGPPLLQRTFFPATPDAANAVAVDVAAGAEVSGIEIRVRREALYSLTASAPTNVGALMAWIEKRPPDPTFQWTGGTTVNRNQFTMRGIPPGSYTLVVETRPPNRAEPRQSARALVDITDHDVEGLPLQFVSTMTVSGTVSVTGKTPVSPQGLHVMLIGVETNRWNWSGTVAEDGTLSFTDVVPDLYRIRVEQPSNAYVASLEIGNTKGVDQVLDLRSRSIEGVKVAVSSDTGMIEGSVPPRSYLTLIPDQSRWEGSMPVRTMIANDDGVYKLVGIIPGHYTLFAWHDVELGTPFDAAFRRPFEKAGVPVDVKPLDHLTINLKEADAQ
jgi:hypothetical protein